jgi:hypothetical protein
MLKILSNTVTAGIEVLVLLKNKFLCACVKGVCRL